MKSLEAKVGGFVVLCAVILTATVYYVSYARFKGARVPFTTYLRDAEGIAPGTQVLFGGITVGKVTSVQPDKSDPTRIQISLDVKQGTPLNAKSVAKVGSVSLMSDPVLSITTGTRDALRLIPGGVIPSQETVSMDELQRKMATLADSAQVTLTEVTADLNNISGDTRHLLANLNDATGSTNRKHLAGILNNTDATVAQLSPQLNQITGKVNGLLDKLGPTVDNVNATVSNTNQTITAIREPSQADLAELQKTLEQTRGLINDLQVLVRANAQNTTYTMENLRMATDNLNQLTESVKERPWSLVRIRQPKDRSVPK
jgi:phospholipid/cholesterol/gamma-HCH transport system substrate-binding protein